MSPVSVRCGTFTPKQAVARLRLGVLCDGSTVPRFYDPYIECQDGNNFDMPFPKPTETREFDVYICHTTVDFPGQSQAPRSTDALGAFTDFRWSALADPSCFSFVAGATNPPTPNPTSSPTTPQPNPPSFAPTLIVTPPPTPIPTVSTTNQAGNRCITNDGFNDEFNDLLLEVFPDIGKPESSTQGAAIHGWPMNEWCVSQLTDFSEMFYDPSLLFDSFNEDLTKWDMANAVTTERMFFQAQSYNQDLCSWGLKLNPNVVTADMFVGTNCPNTSDPSFDISPPGPFCHDCAPATPPPTPAQTLGSTSPGQTSPPMSAASSIGEIRTCAVLLSFLAVI